MLNVLLADDDDATDDDDDDDMVSVQPSQDMLVMRVC